jgi:hypothetical protein
MMIIVVREEAVEMVEILVWEDEVVPALGADVADAAVIGNLIS